MKNTILIICLLALLSSPAYAFQISQVLPSDDEPRRSLTITEEKFDCYQSLQCLMKEAPMQIPNMNDIRLTQNSADRIRVNGSTDQVTMNAIYNGNGDLIQATVIQRNVALPRSITTVLVSDDLKSWEMIGNEVTIENFNKKTMQYKVILKRGSDVKIEYFNRDGEFQNRFG